MAANSEEQQPVSEEPENFEEDISEGTIPLSSGSIAFSGIDTTDLYGQPVGLLDNLEVPEENERNPLLELKKCKEWLQHHRVDHEAELLARWLQQAEDLQPSSSDSSQSDLYDRISKLQDQLYSLSTARSYKKLVLDRVLCGDVLIKKLFPDTVTDSPTEDDMRAMSFFAKICEKQNKLSSDILAEHEALMESQVILDRLKRDNYEKKRENRKLMQQLQKLKEDKEIAAVSGSDSATIQQLNQELNQTMEKIEIVRNVFQGVIVGSGLDWASEEEMKNLVLSLGEPLEF